LPNTTLTSPDNTIYFETNDVWHRERKRIGTNFMDFDDNPYSSHQYYLKYLTKSATIDTEELMSAQYMFVLLSHVGALIRWLDTPLIYLENYHSKTKKDFIKSFTHFFKPVNRHLLPECVIKDIDHLCRWFSGKDKFFSRRDNHDKGFLVFDTMPKYRFHFDYDAMSQLFHDIFIKVIGRDTDLLRGIMKWQKFVTFFPGKKQLDLISYNYDDVAQKKSESFYLSKWTVDFDTLELSEVHDKFRKMQDVHFIPNLLWEEIDTSLQIPLNLKDEQFQFKNSVKTINHARI
jgi:hypothetical protein